MILYGQLDSLSNMTFSFDVSKLASSKHRNKLETGEWFESLPAHIICDNSKQLNAQTKLKITGIAKQLAETFFVIMEDCDGYTEDVKDFFWKVLMDTESVHVMQGSNMFWTYNGKTIVGEEYMFDSFDFSDEYYPSEEEEVYEEKIEESESLKNQEKEVEEKIIVQFGDDPKLELKPQPKPSSWLGNVVSFLADRF